MAARARDPRSGFTLVELMMCMIVLMVAFTGFAEMFSNGNLLASNNRGRLYALSALRHEFESLRNMTSAEFDAIDALDDTTFANDPLANLDQGEGRIYIDAGAGADIRKVTLEVSWESPTGQDLSESLVTFIGRNGINGQ